MISALIGNILSCSISQGKTISVNWLLCYRFFMFILMKSEKWSSYDPKTLILTNFTISIKITCFLALPPSFYRFHQNKKNWNSKLNHFHSIFNNFLQRSSFLRLLQQLLFFIYCKNFSKSPYPIVYVCFVVFSSRGKIYVQPQEVHRILKK